MVFLWITFGTIFAGAVHDYFSGMMSERNEGASISEISGIYLGGAMKNVMRVFSVVLLVMVGTVFAVGPAGLIQLLFTNGGSTGIVASKLFWLVLILIYYFIATFLSIDKIIGKIYPLFGICLIIMALGVALGIFTKGYEIPRSGTTSPTSTRRALRSGASCSSPSPAARSPASMPRRAPDGSLHEEREAGPLRLLRRNGL